MEHKSIKINWTKVNVVIFDVDGTLYNQRKMRSYMLKELLQYYILNLHRLKELKILCDFRREREKRVFDSVNDIENVQYNWGAQASGVSPERVRNVVAKWIYTIPLNHISNCRYPGVLEFFDSLSSRAIFTAVFSDYPAKEKMTALGLSPSCIVSATDKNVDKLKPDPRGLFVITESLGVSVENCLFIGDRDDRDGECARRAAMPYLILEQRNARNKYQFQTYLDLNEQLNGSL